MSTVTVAEAVVVGVGESADSEAAVQYAAAAAFDQGRPLTLVSATTTGQQLLEVTPPDQDRRRESMEQLRERVVSEHPGLTVGTETRFGPGPWELLSSSRDKAELVMGRGGLGPIGRVLLGSNPIRVAARAPVTVVVVPPGWSVREHAADPIVAGVDPEHPNDRLLEYAFTRAEHLGVPLRVVHAAALSPLQGTTSEADAAGYREWGDEAAAALAGVLEPVRDAFPSVEVEILRDRGQAAGLILTHAQDAQLVVVGRRHARPDALGLGSVAREVLHRAQLPVAVVPPAG